MHHNSCLELAKTFASFLLKMLLLVFSEMVWPGTLHLASRIDFNFVIPPAATINLKCSDLEYIYVFILD